jgi:aconitase B
MMGGYNITPLIELLDINATAQIACDALSKTLLIYEASGRPFSLSCAMVLSGLSIFLTSIDWACRGISGRDHASVAGDKKMQMGDEITLYPYEGKIINANGETISTFKLTPNTLPDEVRAGGRIPRNIVTQYHATTAFIWYIINIIAHVP